MPAKGRGTIKFLINEDVVLIDKEDLDILMSISSQSTRLLSRTKYVQCKVNEELTTTLHILIMKKHFGETPKGMVIDHINRNGLDNRKDNLRIITRSNNLLNARKRLGKTTSRYKGVHFHKLRQKWAACFKRKHIGLFTSEEMAFEAYKKASKDYADFVLYDDGSVK